MPSATETTNLSTLKQFLGALGPNDKRFAEDLIRAAEGRRGASEKQWQWIGTLAGRAVTPRPATVNIGDLAPVIALFDTAAQRGHNRRAILLDGGADVGALRVTVAGGQSRNPGDLNVTDRGSYNPATGESDRKWFGRIDRAGNFHPSRREPTPPGMMDALKAFALDPAGTARLYGQRTGCCMFCARELTDARSVDMGYGPVCADKWGLPWGETH